MTDLTNSHTSTTATLTSLAEERVALEEKEKSMRDMVLAARKTIDDVVCTQAAECFEQPEWLEIMEADGVRFEDGEKVEMLLDSLRRGLSEKNAPMVYQVRSSMVRSRMSYDFADLFSTYVRLSWTQYC